MGRFLVTRALHSLVALVGLVVLVFFLARLAGNPADLYLPVDASLEARAEFSEKHGLNDSAIVQFGRFLGDLARLDLGHSIRKDQPALTVVLRAFPTTLALAAVTMTLALSGALVLGAQAARRPGGALDRFASIPSLAAASAPDFWVAIVAILLFAVTLGWLPTSGTGGPLYWILPIGVLVIRPFGLLLQVVRGAMLDALASNYVQTARAKGLREMRIVFTHALRNALLPVLTVAGDLSASIVNGAVIVETIFGWPGIGRLMIDAVMQRDFAVLQAAVLVTATAIFIMNIVVDLLYTVIDPRISHD